MPRSLLRTSMLLAACVPAACALAGCHRGKVRLAREPGGEEHEWRTPLVAEEFRSPCGRVPYKVEAPVGYSEARTQPIKGFVVNTQLRWNSAVRPVSGYFDDLCMLHNTGAISLQEFNDRHAELAAAVETLNAWKLDLDAALDDHGTAEALVQRAEGGSPQRTRASTAAVGAARTKAQRLVQKAALLVRDLAPADPIQESAA